MEKFNGTATLNAMAKAIMASDDTESSFILLQKESETEKTMGVSCAVHCSTKELLHFSDAIIAQLTKTLKEQGMPAIAIIDTLSGICAKSTKDMFDKSEMEEGFSSLLGKMFNEDEDEDEEDED